MAEVVVPKRQDPTGTREPTALEKTQWTRYGPDAVKWNLRESPNLIARHVFDVSCPVTIASWTTNNKSIGDLILERSQSTRYELGGCEDDLIVLIIFRNLLTELKNLGIAAQSINHTGDWSRLRQVGKIIWQIVTRGRFYDAVNDQPLLTFSDGQGGLQTFTNFRTTVLDQKYHTSIMGILYSIVGSTPGPPLPLDQVLATINARIYINSVEPMERIPGNLKPDEEVVYHVLRKVKAARGNSPARHVLMVCDIAKDYDDLAAVIVLKELHRLGFIELMGVVTNLEPAERRARFGRGALNLLGLNEVPVGKGLPANDNKPNLPILDHEFLEAEKTFSVPDDTDILDGQAIIENACEKARKEGFKISLLLTSSLTDINTFAKNHTDLLSDVVQDITLQGGYVVENDQPKPSLNAANNAFDEKAAKEFHKFMGDHQIPSIVFTKSAAFATDILSPFLMELEATGHPLGAHFRDTQVKQEIEFFSRTLQGRPYAPFMNVLWYLTNKTTWFNSHPRDGPLPTTVEEVMPYLDKVIMYDALAAVAVAGQEVLDAFNILDISGEQDGPIHKIVGVEAVMQKAVAAKPATPRVIHADGTITPAKLAVPAVKAATIAEVIPGLRGQAMAAVIKALLKGSLVACQQGEYFAVQSSKSQSS